MWDDSNLGLKGLARAMFREGRFTDVADGTATLELPNAVHRDKCESRRPEVEAALSAHFGTRLTLRLTADGGGGGGTGPSGGGGRPSDPEPGPAEDLDLSVADVRDLPDAPAPAAGGIDALTEAFPGAEFVE